MRITESSLRRLIREVITDELDSESFMMPGSYGAIEDEEMFIEDLEAKFEKYSDIIRDPRINIEKADGYDEVDKLQEEVVKLQKAHEEAKKAHEEAKKAYEEKLRGFIGDVIDMHGEDLNRI